jgi:PAS domain S-box-containing protein
VTRKLELTAFGFAVALMLLVEYVGHRSAQALVEAARGVEHTHEVIGELDALLIAALDAETGRRGYGLTGDETLLVPYHDAASRADAHTAKLRALTADSPDQARRIAALEPRLKARLQALDESVTAQRNSGRAEYGATPGALRGHEDMEIVRAAIDEMATEERRLLAEREQRTRDGVMRAEAVQLGGGALGIALLVVVVLRLRRAIREREASERRVRENEENLATTLESIGDGVVATDSEGRITRINSVATAITGWDLESARGKPIDEVFRVVHEVTSKELANPIAEALRRGETVELDDSAMLVAKDGTTRRIADSAAPIRGSDGRVHGAVLVFRDITKALEDARSLRRAHAFLDSIIENIPDMVFVKDADDLAFVRFNRAGESLLGMKRGDLIGKTDFAFFPPDQAKAFVDKDRETLRGKKVLDIPEEPLTTANGVRWLHTKKVPVLDERGDPEYLLGISADITERRRAEVLLRSSKQATETAHRELEAFSNSVAYDLRAPLRSIDAFSQALLVDYADKLDDQGKTYVARVRNASRRMAELLEDLLALARVSRTELARSPIDLSTIAREVGEGLKKDLYPHAELVVTEGLTANADPTLVRVLLDNLVANAFEFSSKREHPRIEVGKRTETGHDVFFVRDNGVGFDRAAAQNLFKAVHRDQPGVDGEATGVGLATAERIVSRHSGRIWAESEPDAGATFYFTLEAAEGTRR